MGESLEMWAFILANMSSFMGGGLLTVLSYLAYRQSSGQPSYRFASIGFGLVALSCLFDPAYLSGVAVDLRPSGTEFLILTASEDLVLAIGLGVVFYAITQHDSGASSMADDHPASIDEGMAWKHDPWDDD